MHFASGFTLIEVMFSLTFISILALLGYLSFAPLRTNADIVATGNQVIGVLQLARNRTLSSLNDTTHGVHFENDQYVLFSGDSYDAMAADNEVRELPAGVEIHDISVAGAPDVLFDRLTGTTSNSGEIGLRLVSDNSETRTISVLASGIVGLAGTTSPTDTRVTDTRHVHFDLGWSIQGASTLTLTFSDPPNPDHVENIDMSTFFDAGQTVFDWGGTITVSGSGQQMRIHTHSLDASNTQLSITRDGRFNDKGVAISVDGQEIVSYDASGSATVGSSGGTMTVQ